MFIFFNLINMRKNLFKCLVIVPVMFWLILWVCFWQLRGLRWWDGWSDAELDSKNPYTDPSVDTLVCDGYTDLWNCTSVKERNDTIIVRLLKVFGLNDSIEKEKDLKFIDYARAILNMALGLLAFIALIMTIYTFYMMFFTENEAWAKKAKESLVGIFIALGIIWLAWLIVSFIFWWYQSNWQNNQDDIEKKLTREVSMLTDKTINNQIYLTI